ncbi:MAG: DUF3885 domain-containing protein [Pseudomonadota bacterium]
MPKIQENFGFQELPHALFYSFDRSLRFELGGEKFGTNRPIRRFFQAHVRSSAISQTLLKKSSEVYVLLSSYGLEQPGKKRLDPLKLCGINCSEIQYLGKTPQQDEHHAAEIGSDLFRHWDIVRLNDKETISEILWLGISSEMRIEPSFRDSMQAYFVDESGELILHVYDDRGMDVAATRDEPMKELFSKYREWLLEHDLPRMNAMFGSDA